MKNGKKEHSHLSAREIEAAESYWLYVSQCDHFFEEIELLKKKDKPLQDPAVFCISTHSWIHIHCCMLVVESKIPRYQAQASIYLMFIESILL